MSPQTPRLTPHGIDNIIDPDILDELSHLGEGSHSFVGQLIARFVDQSQRGLTQIEQATVLRDTDTIRLVGHRMKGSARQVGATLLADACESLVRSAERGDLHMLRIRTSQVQSAWILSLRDLLARDLLLN